MGFGSGFGWGILSGLGQAYGDYAQRSELEKRKKDYDLWQQEHKIADFLALSGDPDMTKHGDIMKDLLNQSKNFREYTRKRSEMQLPGAGEAVTRANVRRQQEAEQKRAQWTTEDTARRAAIQQEAQQGPPTTPGMGPVSPQAMGGPAGLAWNALRQGATRQIAGETAVRKFQELPQRPPSLDRPPVEQSLDPVRGLVPTPEYEQAAQEYAWQRQADIQGESKVKLMGAERREKLTGFKEYAQWLQQEGPKYGMSPEDITDAIQALITGINPRSNRVQYGPPQKNPDGTVTRQAWMNGMPMGMITVPEMSSQSTTTGMKWNADKGIYEPFTSTTERTQSYGGAGAVGGVTGGGGAPYQQAPLSRQGGPRRQAPSGTAAAPSEPYVPGSNWRAALQHEDYVRYVGDAVGAMTRNPKLSADAMKVARAMYFDHQTILESIRGQVDDRTYQGLAAYLTGRDMNELGLYPADKRRIQQIINDNKIPRYDVKDRQELEQTTRILDLVHQMQQKVAEAKGGRGKDAEVELGAIVGSVSSLLSKDLWREAGMLTNQDITRAASLLPVAWNVFGYQWSPTRIEDWLTGGAPARKLAILQRFLLTKKAVFNLTRSGEFGAAASVPTLSDADFNAIFVQGGEGPAAAPNAPAQATPAQPSATPGVDPLEETKRQLRRIGKISSGDTAGATAAAPNLTGVYPPGQEPQEFRGYTPLPRKPGVVENVLGALGTSFEAMGSAFMSPEERRRRYEEKKKKKAAYGR